MFEDLKNNRLVRNIGLAVVVIGVVALVIGGAGIFAGVLLLFLMGLSTCFGSIRILSGSALLAVLLKSMGGTIKALAGVWYAGPKLDQFFNLVAATGYVDLILTFFFVFYLVSFGTGCIRLFSFENTTKIENGEKDAEPKEPEKKTETYKVYAGR